MTLTEHSMHRPELFQRDYHHHEHNHHNHNHDWEEHEQIVDGAQIRAITRYALAVAKEGKPTPTKDETQLSGEMIDSIFDHAAGFSESILSLTDRQERRFAHVFSSLYNHLPEKDEQSHHGHYHHDGTDSGSGRALQLENLYLDTHTDLQKVWTIMAPLTLGSIKKRNHNRYLWQPVTDPEAIQTAEGEIYEIEARLGEQFIGGYDQLHPFAQQFFLRRFTYERDRLDPMLPKRSVFVWVEDMMTKFFHKYGGNTELAHHVAERAAAGLAFAACQVDCTIPTIAKFVSAFATGLGGDDHAHIDQGILSDGPRYVHADKTFTPQNLTLADVLSEQLPDEYKSEAIALAGEEQQKAESKLIPSRTWLQKIGLSLVSKEERANIQAESWEERRQQWIVYEAQHANAWARAQIQEQAIAGEAWALRALAPSQEQVVFTTCK